MSNMASPGSGNLELMKRIEALEQENETKTLVIEGGVNVIYNDHIVTLNISTGNLQLTTGWNTIAEIPEGVRPITNITFAGLIDEGSVSESLFMRLQIDGLLVVWVPSNLTNAKCYGNITYLR